MSVNNGDSDELARDKKSSVSSEDRSLRAMSLVGPEDAVDIDANVQHAGILKKPPFGSKSYGKLTRWTERFCVVKESFLLYYEKSEKKSYESKKMFNIHPKGVIPLAGCTIENFDDIGKPCFKITHASFKTADEGVFQLKKRSASISIPTFRRDSFMLNSGRKDSDGGNLVLAARSPEERDIWVSVLNECSKVTWNNAQLGAAQIKLLEDNTARINKEKRDYIEKLQAEAEHRKHEEGKKEELEALAKQLEGEKLNMENIANKFKEEKEMTTQELQEAMNAMKQLDEERQKMDDQSKQLQENLQRLEEEKLRADSLLKEREEQAVKLKDDKASLEATSSNLKSHLESLEEAAKRLEEEKKRTAEQLAVNEQKVLGYQEEKIKLVRTATEAQLKVEEVAKEKVLAEKQLDITATTLEIEKTEKKKLEKRLRLAEDSLKRLDAALKESGLKVSLEIEADVTTLKSFFEDAAAEAQLQAKKHLLMEKAVRAKKVYEQRAFTKTPHKPDMFSARQHMNKVDVDPRLKGVSQSTTSPDHSRTSSDAVDTTPVDTEDTTPVPSDKTPEITSPMSKEETEETASPREETASPLKETASPLVETASTLEERASPLEETASTLDETASPLVETASTLDETASPREETASTLEETASTLEETVSPQDNEALNEKAADREVAGIEAKSEAPAQEDQTTNDKPGSPGEEKPGSPGEEKPGSPGEEKPSSPGEEKPGEEKPGSPSEEKPQDSDRTVSLSNVDCALELGS